MNSMNTSFISCFRHGLIAALICLCAVQTQAQTGGAVLLRGQGVVITADDVLADMERLPDELRRELMAEPAKIEQLAVNLYVRRVLAKRAADAGFDKDPRIVAIQQIGADKFLSEIYLGKTVAATQPPDDNALEKLARAYYVANEAEFTHGEQRRVRHILIGKAEPKANALAEELLKKLQDGADFASLAKDYSADSVTKPNGGDLGWFGAGKMVPSFERAAFGMAKKGDLAGPVETPYGLHLLRLDGIRPPGKRPYDEVSGDIKRSLLEKLAKERRAEIIVPIRDSAQPDPLAIKSFTQQGR